MQLGQRSTCGSCNIQFKSSNAPILIAAKSSRPTECKCFHSDLFNFLLSTCIRQTVWSRCSDVKSKSTHFCPLEGTSNPKVDTTECIKVHYYPFWCLLSVKAGVVKRGTNAMSQGRWKNINDWVAGIRHKGPGHTWGANWRGRTNACIWKYFLHFQVLVWDYWVVLM